jgi:flagellar motor switch protein FliN/FliY
MAENDARQTPETAVGAEEAPAARPVDQDLTLDDLGAEALPETAQGGPILGNYAEQDYKPKSSSELEAVYDIPVQVTAILGRSSMQVNQILQLGRGAVIELDRKVGEPIDIFVNNRLVARGEVVVVEDRLGITMTEIIKTEGN